MLSLRLTIFADRACTQIARIAELHGRDAERWERAMSLFVPLPLEARTYAAVGVRVDEVLDRR